MTATVVDASVVAAAFLPEAHSQAARAVLLAGADLLAPDLIYPEVANVLWKRCNRGEITEDQAAGILRDVMVIPLKITASEQLAAQALELALRTRRTVYDCLYLTLAVKNNAVMVSNDRRLVNALAGGPLTNYVVWLGSAKRG